MASTPPASDDPTRLESTAYLARTVTLAAEVTAALPAGSPTAWRRLAYRVILSAVLHDAVENETDGLDAQDVANLSRFIREAAAAASRAALEYRDDAFELVLQALLEDWVDNWNVDDEDG
jgi:hypothetical protein